MFSGDDDPFGFGMFRHMQRQMHEMDRMMDSMMDPFGFMMQRPAPRALEGRRRGQLPPDQELAHPFAPFGLGGFGIGGMFNAINHMQEHAMNDPNSHVFTSSTMMTFDDEGRPRVVNRSTRKAGDVREDRRTFRDAEREEMEIGHTIGDRTHVIEKKRDKDGNVRKQQRFVNLDEANAEDFDREFQTRARRNIGVGSRSRTQEDRRAIGSSSSSSRYHNATSAGSSEGPIITLPDEDEEPAQDANQSRRGGPIIREISEEEARQSVPKRRRGPFGMFRAGDD